MDNIKCPECGHSFELSQSVFSDLENDLKKKFTAKEIELEMRLAESKKQVEDRLTAEKEQFVKGIEEETSKRIKLDFDLKSSFLQKQVEDTNKKYLESQEKIQGLLKQLTTSTHTVEEERTKLLEKYSAAKRELENKVRIEESEKQRLKFLEKEKIINDQKNQLANMTRKLEQGSQQNQGEVFELEIESKLQVKFPQDVIKEVGKGVQGADIIQVVRNNMLQECGKVIIEIKNTQSFAKKWVDKLKSDKRVAGADVAILLTTVLPADVKYFTIQDGIIICNYGSFFNLLGIFRSRIIDMQGLKVSNQNKADKLDILYDYVTDKKFVEKLQTLYDLYSNMKGSLDTEKNSIKRAWTKRETELEVFVSNVNDMWGGLNAITGAFPEKF